MDTTFATILAPLGCFSSTRCGLYLQRDTQSYVRDHKRVDEKAERRKLVRHVLSTPRCTRELIAAAEAYLTVTTGHASWFRLRDTEKESKVRLLISNIRALAKIELAKVEAQ